MMAQSVDPGTEVGRLQVGKRNGKDLGFSAQDRCEGLSHRADRPNRPELIEDKPHDDERQTNADESIACGRQLGGGAGCSERYREERESDLEPDVPESAAG